MKFVKAALAASAFWPLSSYAVLGGAPSVNADANAAATARSMLQSAAVEPYTMRESEDADGVTIHEYALPTNVVFAVTWQGPVRPDMRALLGSYFPNFANAGTSQARGAGPMVERSGDFHIESAGRAGHFFGKAVLPRLVPANVRVDQLP
ncbi:DUF2844 domain-containing protein [Paraburkholderia sp. BL21I4N1]|uniref:DUF2844 domain-containing protein n=1 Tax=Paraburkholderia sp. BL21I4N1 TaxID=1938801 RepID=UPI000CFB1AD0|nr:DUF2844 domain-containing protein [Paraburkholderia sp. BL21I4N1]PQV52552.1 uncharacterized protein DUF2844 [Paraburkholderia sp. BL21I4N1]